MITPQQRERIEQIVLPHLDAAYDLARWLTRNDHDAQDVVQEAFLRAARHIGTYRNGEARAWVLAIVRNSCYAWLRQRHPEVALDDAAFDAMPDTAPGPEECVDRLQTARTMNEALAALPVAFREVVVLRDLEDLSYKEIAVVVNRPIGTVMSRLARGRALLRDSPLVHSLMGSGAARVATLVRDDP